MAEVTLRETIDADLGTLFEFQADPEASAMTAFPSRDRPASLEHQARIQADPSAIRRTIVADVGVVGSIGSWETEGERDVGFWIGRDHWGKGYATAALRAFLDVDLHRPLHAHVAATTSVPDACSRSAASYSTIRHRKETCWSTCSC